MEKNQAVLLDTKWVLQSYGSQAGEKEKPGSRAESQAKRIAEFQKQWDLAEELFTEHGIDLLVLEPLHQPFQKSKK